MNSRRVIQRLLRLGQRPPASAGWTPTAAVLLSCLFATPLFPEALPFANDEVLVYAVTWPSGLSLGEVEFRAHTTQQGWSFEADVSADLPLIEIRDEYRSTADHELCSLEFEKDIQHGNRTTRESVTFDQQDQTATRRTLGGGGESEIDIPPCARDGLTFFYYLRQQLALGRIPPPDDINFGGQYQITLSYVETREILDRGALRTADRLLFDLTGPKSHHSFEIFFGRDPARTPLLMQVPFALGTFSIKLTK